MKHLRLSALIGSVLFVVFFAFGCASRPVAAPSAPAAAAPQAPTEGPPPAPAPTLILISIDGLRWDYARKFGMTSLLAMAADGATAESLIPVYPSKTFPNHYSIVTGCYADRHGIVSNDFFDPERGAGYKISDRAAVADGSWYGCDPLWNVVERRGLPAATFFWIGSDAAIAGRRPTQWRPYDEQVPNEARVDQALEWLRLPEGERPRLITLYFSAVDSAAHKHGPESDEARAAAQAVDGVIGRLRAGVQASGIPANMIVVSDHGMAATDPSKIVWIDEAANLDGWIEKGGGPQASLYLWPAVADAQEKARRVRALQKKLEASGGRHWRVWRREQVPKALHFSESPRVGDLIVDMDPHWSVAMKSRGDKTPKGNHGWDPARVKEMRGSFFAEGPAFQAGARVASFPNVDLFSMMLSIMGVDPAGLPSQGAPGSPVWRSLKTKAAQ